jgi:hypothetical protein
MRLVTHSREMRRPVETATNRLYRPGSKAGQRPHGLTIRQALDDGHEPVRVRPIKLPHTSARPQLMKLGVACHAKRLDMSSAGLKECMSVYVYRIGLIGMFSGAPPGRNPVVQRQDRFRAADLTWSK